MDIIAGIFIVLLMIIGIVMTFAAVQTHEPRDGAGKFIAVTLFVWVALASIGALGIGGMYLVRKLFE